MPNAKGFPVLSRSLVYFVAIGIGFMCFEMATMQQLSIFLGQPVYSMVVVLFGLILSTGLGSLISDRWPTRHLWQMRIPPAAGAVLIWIYSVAVLPVIHNTISAVLWQRVLICLLLIVPPGFALGFCFPLGLRRLNGSDMEGSLPWMWAVNGAAGTLGTFIATLISMETSIRVCVLVSAACYLLAVIASPRRTMPSSIGAWNVSKPAGGSLNSLS